MGQLKSVFVAEYKFRNEWIKELRFYHGDFSDVDLSIDWRFKECKGRRKQLVLLGTTTTAFPIKYPLILDNGVVINEDDYDQETTGD